MPAAFGCPWDFASVAYSSSWNLDYDFAAAHSPVAEVVHRSLVVGENHSGDRAPVVAEGNHRDFRSCLVEEGDRRDSHNYLVVIPEPRNRSLPA